jgi:hypothetical protein
MTIALELSLDDSPSWGVGLLAVNTNLGTPGGGTANGAQSQQPIAFVQNLQDAFVQQW